MSIDRRSFLQFLASGAVAASLPSSIARALAIPANNVTGTIADVEHIIFLMQENRSFDHYFGSLKGVRGFGDPRAVTLPNGDPVWQQPTGSGTSVLPFHPTLEDLGLQFLQDLPHDWTTTHQAWNNGNFDQWVPTKGPVSMAHLTRADIPFHYALADAFTICDAYHCSVLGPTYPNKYHMLSGNTGNCSAQPQLDNGGGGFTWLTYPERLQQAGVTWKVYQDLGEGLNAGNNWGRNSDPFVGNFGVNSLLQFSAFQRAVPGTPLYDNARSGTNVTLGGTLFDSFRKDVLSNRLPQVSWIVAPEAFIEHPNWPANYGAWYISQILDSLTANPEVWSKTVFFLMYDENDGFFDHMVPPTPPGSSVQGLSGVSTRDEIFEGNDEFPAGPYGLGIRVPLIVISPWSRGGWVDSQVFDHTSLLRFMEARFAGTHPGLGAPDITPWRRAITGDLVSAFDFATPNKTTPILPSTAAYLPPDTQRHPAALLEPPEAQSMPVQEHGVRPARAVPYVLNASCKVDFATGVVKLTFHNGGTRAAVFQVRSGVPSSIAVPGPWSYTVAPGSQLTDHWAVAASGETAYDLSIHGPNGFFRRFKGNLSAIDPTGLHSTIHYQAGPSSIPLTASLPARDNDHVFASRMLNKKKGADNFIGLVARNISSRAATLQLKNVYTGEINTRPLEPGAAFEWIVDLAGSAGWYDFILELDTDSIFQQRFAGHLETGRASTSDPAMGRSQTARI